jgi:hypothetical protein
MSFAARVRSLGFRTACLLLGLAASSCRREDPPRTSEADVERCLGGIARARTQPTRREGLEVFYTECASVYVEASCHGAFILASKVDYDRQLKLVSETCARAYCPLLSGASELEFCRANFQGSPGADERAWPPLHDAILAFDAKSAAPRLAQAMLRFYALLQSWPSPAIGAAPTTGDPSGSAPAASGSAPAASGSAPAASGSAPAASGSAPAASGSARPSAPN